MFYSYVHDNSQVDLVVMQETVLPFKTEPHRNKISYEQIADWVTCGFCR